MFTYLSKFFSVTVEVCEPLKKLTSVKAEWSWNRSYKSVYGKAKRLITKDACMKFHNELKSLYLEMYVSGIGLRDGLLQI